MNCENLFLIHEDTYIDHINEKIRLYSMVQQLASMAKALPSNRGSAALTRLATTLDKESEEMFKSWGIPGSYLLFGNSDDLTGVMFDELLTPEAAGYVHFGGDCKECCRNEDALGKEIKASDGADIGELFTLIGEVMHSILGDSVTIHIRTE